MLLSCTTKPKYFSNDICLLNRINVLWLLHDTLYVSTEMYTRDWSFVFVILFTVFVRVGIYCLGSKFRKFL